MSDAPAALLDRRSLADQVAEQLLDLIRRDGLVPGDVLPSQATLSARFGVSRPILREAMRALVGSGVIVVRNGKGAAVAPISRDPLLHFFQRALQFERDAVVQLMEMRKGIEVQAAALAAQRRRPEEAARMRRIADEMREHLRDPDRYNALDLRLHLAIVEATHNRMLEHLMASVRETLHDSIQAGFRHRQGDGFLQRTQDLHEDVVAAIEAGERERARAAMERHFDDAIEAILTQPVTR
jgi:GntR family transcriptional repressor for pyruvate dehydrogenase complex